MKKTFGFLAVVLLAAAPLAAQEQQAPPETSTTSTPKARARVTFAFIARKPDEAIPLPTSTLTPRPPSSLA